MPTIIPTPFDILDLPPGPLEPPLTAWILVGLFACAILIFRRLLTRKKGASSPQKDIVVLCEELGRVVANATSPLCSQRASRLAQRILSPYVSSDVPSLSPADMHSLAETLGSSTSERDHSCASILKILAELEDLAYSPSSEHAAIRPRVIQLKDAIDTLVRRHRLA